MRGWSGETQQISSNIKYLLFSETSLPWRWHYPAVSAAAGSCPPPPCYRAGWVLRLYVTSHRWLLQSDSSLCSAAPPPEYAFLNKGSWNSLKRERSKNLPVRPTIRNRHCPDCCPFRWGHRGILTGQYGASLALLLNISMFLSRQSEWRLEHKAVDVVVSLKIRPFVLLFFLIKVGHYICHLNVGKLWVQVFRIHLKNVKQVVIAPQTNGPAKQFIHCNGQILFFLPCWSPGSFWHYQLQTCLSRVWVISVRFPTAPSASALCRWTLCSPPPQRNPTRTHMTHNY